jgi:hypothetical protein
MLGALGAAFLYQRRDVPVRQVAAFLPLAAILSVPAISAASTFVSPGAEHTLTSNNELGNLARPLRAVQALGIWPTGDFRTNPVDSAPAYLLIGVLLFSALVGIVLALRRRNWELPLAVAGVAVALLIVTHFGSPWVDGKAMATAAPAFILAGVAGAGVVFTRGRRVEGALLAVGIVFGVLWSDALAYRDASLAPRPQLAELQHIGKLLDDTGPTLMTDYEPYGVRHFLRDAAPEGASEFRWRQVPLREGTLLPKATFADLDRFQLQGILVYRTIVLHRSPVESRPPAPYKLIWQGRYFEAWQRPARARQVIDHLPLGDGDDPGAVPKCASVLAEASRVPAGGELAAAVRTRPTIVSIKLTRAGAVSAGALVQHTGTYSVWLGGSFGSKVSVYVHGHMVASHRNGLEWEQWQQFGSVRLTAGDPADVRVVYDGRSFLHPGSGTTATPIGPLALARQTANVPVTYLPASQARSLCGKYLDWVEALGPAS